MANRLSIILPNIISPQQSGFVKGRSITDNIMLAQEIIHNINKKCRGDNVAIKLDMEKAYDKVSWLFLTKVLRAFGFNEVWIDMVWRNISSSYYSVIINGSTNGFFKSSRGLKQGDPLSSSLFILAAEVLSRGLQGNMENNKIKKFYQPVGTPKISHLGFADDILIFCNGGKRSIQNLKRFFDDYQDISGQRLNIKKCSFVISSKADSNKVRMIKDITGFKKQDLPFKYLGCPIFTGRAKICYFNELIDNIRNRVQGWQTNILNQAGRLILIKHVLQSIPIHICAAISPPKAVIKEIESICCKCLWWDYNSNKKHHWIAWEVCCRSLDEGGLGIRKLEDIIKVQSIKLFWKLVSDNSLWANYMKIKYKREWNEEENYTYYSRSNVWSRIMKVKDIANNFIIQADDNHRWILSRNGTFSTSLTWNTIREKHSVNFPFKNIWYRYTPKKMAIFMWKLTHYRLPLDKNLQAIGVNLASKCLCCLNNNCESITHLFFNSDIAMCIWNFYINSLGYRVNWNNFSSFLKSWWIKSKGKRNSPIIYICLPIVICWEIWKERNMAFFDDSSMNSFLIIQNINSSWRNIKFASKAKINDDIRDFESFLDLRNGQR